MNLSVCYIDDAAIPSSDLLLFLLYQTTSADQVKSLYRWLGLEAYGVDHSMSEKVVSR